MNWKIKLTGRPRQKVLITFDPFNEMVQFSGWYKLDKTTTWVMFVDKILPASDMISDKFITINILDIYDKMKPKIESYERFSNILSTMKGINACVEIEIDGDELEKDTDDLIVGKPID